MLYKYRYLPLITFGLLWLPLPVVAVLLLPTVSGLFFVGGIKVWFIAGVLLAGATQYYQTRKPTNSLCTKFLETYPKLVREKDQIKALIKQGANPYAYPMRTLQEPFGKKGGDIMSLAIQNDDVDMVLFLLNNGYDINHFIRYKHMDKWYYDTPLMLAARLNNETITNDLLSKGANTMAANYARETAHDIAHPDSTVKAALLNHTKSGHDFPQSPPTRYSRNIANTLAYLLPMFLFVSALLVLLQLSNSVIFYEVMGSMITLLLIVVAEEIEGSITNDWEMAEHLMITAIKNSDYALVTALLNRGISTKFVSNNSIQLLLTNYPATINALLKEDDTTTLTQEEQALRIEILLQKHAYEKTFSGWLKSFQTPTEPLLKDISLIDLEQVEICLEQEHKDAIIEAGQSIINDLTILGKNTKKQKDAIQALQNAPHVLQTNKWKSIIKDILRAFHTDKLLPNIQCPDTTNSSLSPKEKAIAKIFDNARNIVERKGIINKPSSSINVETLQALIQRIKTPSSTKQPMSAASSGEFTPSILLLQPRKGKRFPASKPWESLSQKSAFRIDPTYCTYRT